LGGGSVAGASEMAFLNAEDSWSVRPTASASAATATAATTASAPAVALPTEVVQEFTDSGLKPAKSYKGTATTEVFTLVQYGAHLKNKGYKVLGLYNLDFIEATARTDNPGSWKSLAKSGFEVTSIDANPKYGPELRYQLRRQMR
jgi:hypothetical protein